jgi:hypothetical protein
MCSEKEKINTKQGCIVDGIIVCECKVKIGCLEFFNEMINNFASKTKIPIFSNAI